MIRGGIAFLLLATSCPAWVESVEFPWRDIPKPLWERRIPADERNRITLGLRPLLIRTDTETILVDAGVSELRPSRVLSPSRATSSTRDKERE